MLRPSVRLMKFVLTSTVASALVASSAQALLTDYADQIPVTLVATNATPADINKLINTLNSSLGYAMVMNKIRNGTGTHFFYPLSNENIVQQILRETSLFDLYSQKSLKEKKLNNIDLSIYVTPYSADVNQKFAGVKYEDLGKQLQNIAKPFMPVIQQALPDLQDRVKLDSAKSVTTPANVYALRDAQITALTKRFPYANYNGTKEYTTKAAWLAASYLPITVSSSLHVASPNSFEQTHLNTNIIYPAIGVPDMSKAAAINSKYSVEQTLDAINLLPMHLNSHAGVPNTVLLKQPIASDVAVFDDIRFLPDEEHHQFPSDATRDQYEAHAKARAFKIEFIKNFSDPHLVDMAVSFGYMPTRPLAPTDLNMENMQGTDPWNSLVQDMDFGLIVKGDMQLSPSMAKANKIDASKLAQFNKLLGMLELRLGFHKLYFSMNRLQVLDSDIAYLNDVANGDLTPFLQDDPGFSLKNLTLVPDKSVITLKLTLKPEYIQKLDTPFYTFPLQIVPTVTKEQRQEPLETLAVKTFCGVSGIYNFNYSHPLAKDQGLRYSSCEVNFVNYKDFRSFLFKLANNFVMDQTTTAVKDSIGYQTESADKNIDPALQQISSQVLSEIANAEASVTKTILHR